MAVDHSAIEWTDATWSPVTGCTKVSPGCANCYAEGIAKRFWAKQYPAVPDQIRSAFGVIADLGTRPRQFTDVMCHEERLDQPLRWKRPRRIFVNSMSDLFHEHVPDAFIDKVFAVMALAPRHTFQVLTKRADRMRAYLTPGRREAVAAAVYVMPGVKEVRRLTVAVSVSRGLHLSEALPASPRWPLPNVWLGVSVENQRFADERIPLLLQTPAAVRFISAEPLLEFVDLRKGLHLTWTYSAGRSDHIPPPRIDGGWWHDLGTMPHDPPKVDWIIVGGESGKGARPFDVSWGYSIVQQCQVASVPVFVKQLGAVPVVGRSAGTAFVPDHELLLQDRKGGDPAEWPENLRVRQFPGLSAPAAAAARGGTATDAPSTSRVARGE